MCSQLEISEFTFRALCLESKNGIFFLKNFSQNFEIGHFENVQNGKSQKSFISTFFPSLTEILILDVKNQACYL